MMIETNPSSIDPNAFASAEAPAKVAVRVTAKRCLCLRNGPGLNYIAIGVLPLNTQVQACAEALANGEPWLEVTTAEGVTGYVAAAFVKEVK